MRTIEFYAHKGKCLDCGEAVKMSRGNRSPFPLLPNQCWCISCGALYKVDTNDNDTEWEKKQWEQKRKDDETDLYHREIE